MFSKIKNYGKNYVALNSTESIFLDFKRVNFADTVALEKYLSLDKSFKKKDKN